ncbi:TIGR00266 family protein, partial [Xanthomonas vasicola]
MAQWYFHTPGQAERIGPLDDANARAHAQRQPNALAWRDGLDGWTPARQLAELHGSSSAPPPLTGAAGRADEIDYRIVGNDMQFVEVELDPGESAIAEAGALMYKDAAVQMDTVFGDDSHAGQSGGGGLMGKLLSAGKRVVTG